MIKRFLFRIYVLQLFFVQLYCLRRPQIMEKELVNGGSFSVLLGRGGSVVVRLVWVFAFFSENTSSFPVEVYQNLKWIGRPIDYPRGKLRAKILSVLKRTFVSSSKLNTCVTTYIRPKRWGRHAIPPSSCAPRQSLASNPACSWPQNPPLARWLAVPSTLQGLMF